MKETCSLSRQKLTHSLTKRRSASLAKGLQQARFSAYCHKKQLKPLLCQQCQWYFTDKNVARTEEGVKPALVQTSGSSQKVAFSLMVTNLLGHLPFTFQLRIGNPQGALGWCRKLHNSFTAQTPSFPWLCTHCRVARVRIGRGKGMTPLAHTIVVIFMPAHRTGRWAGPVKMQ